jgi:hypothetical protein
MMSTRKISVNTRVLYFIGLIVIIVAFLQLGGGPWVRGMMHGSGSMSMAGLNWVQILISLAIGILIGWAISRRN